MAGTSRKTGSRIRARFGRIAAIGMIAALATVFTPGTASAATDVTPMVDCYRDNGDGTFWVVLGYQGLASGQRTYSYGPTNTVYPARLQGQQPTVFYSGTVHGVWTVKLTDDEIFRENARWILNGTTLQYARYVKYATVCPPSTQLPADGNGTGTAVGLGAAGLLGAAMLYRVRRRMTRPSAGSPSVDAAA